MLRLFSQELEVWEIFPKHNCLIIVVHGYWKKGLNQQISPFTLETWFYTVLSCWTEYFIWQLQIVQYLGKRSVRIAMWFFYFCKTRFLFLSRENPLGKDKKFAINQNTSNRLPKSHSSVIQKVHWSVWN